MLGINKVVSNVKLVLVGTKSFLQNTNWLIGNSTEVADKTNKAMTAAQKIGTGTAGLIGFGKGSVDAIEDLVCQDYVCLTVDCLGCACDVLTFGTSFVPGLNYTSTVTIPLSSGCKSFRWCCKRAKLPFGCRK